MAQKIWFRLLKDLKKIGISNIWRTFLESFKVNFAFPEICLFYSLIKFGIFQSFTNIQWLRSFYLGFWLTSKQAYGKLQYVYKTFEKCVFFLIKYFCNHRAKLAFLSLVSIFNHSEEEYVAFERLKNKFLGIQPCRTLCLVLDCQCA